MLYIIMHLRNMINCRSSVTNGHSLFKPSVSWKFLLLFSNRYNMISLKRLSEKCQFHFHPGLIPRSNLSLMKLFKLRHLLARFSLFNEQSFLALSRSPVTWGMGRKQRRYFSFYVQYIACVVLFKESDTAGLDPQ